MNNIQATFFMDLISMNNCLEVHSEQRMQRKDTCEAVRKEAVLSGECFALLIFFFFSPSSPSDPSTTFQPLTPQSPSKKKICN